MTLQIQNSELKKIYDKVLAAEPVDEKDLYQMLTTNDILELGIIADHVKRQLHGDKVFYGVNMNLNYTNICELRCPLCAYSCDRGDKKGFLFTPEQMEEKVRVAYKNGIDEVHIVGGVIPELDVTYFEDVFKRIKNIDPSIMIVALTATEYDYYAKKSNISVDEFIDRLLEAGLDALPGGGAEIFDPTVRNKIAPKKISGQRWLDVMDKAHQHGLKTNATILYNHLEGATEVVDHLAALREQQEKSRGFKTLVPLPFHEENTQIKARNLISSGYDDVRLYAASRIYLHNFPHIKGLWMYLGEKMAQIMLSMGVDDIGATYYYEKVVHAAGAQTSDYGSEDYLRRLITNAGFQPQRVNALYQERERR